MGARRAAQGTQGQIYGRTGEPGEKVRGFAPETPPRGAAPWSPAKGGALGTLHLERLDGRGPVMATSCDAGENRRHRRKSP